MLIAMVDFRTRLTCFYFYPNGISPWSVSAESNSNKYP